MTPRWHFEKARRGQAQRDPISGEFFATEAIRNSAEALVREGIQNSLDAVSPGERVRVRIYISGDEGAAPAAGATSFFNGLAPHLAVPRNGLAEEGRPDPSQPCRFLLFEDFGTQGLLGDPAQWHRKENVRNGFFAFFRAEGENAKSDSDRRGRWGVGKFVFPRASHGNTFFGLTIRPGESRALLLGRSILRSHEIRGTPYMPDGFFGLVDESPDGALVLPVEGGDVVERFRRVFRLSRASEPGLSLVVPWYDQEITRERLLEAAMRDWFFSILAGELIVQIADDEATVELSGESFEQHLDALPETVQAELRPLSSLARFATSEQGRNPTVIGEADTTNKPKWHEAMLSDEVKASLRGALESLSPVAVRVPVRVRPRKAAPEQSHLDIFIIKDPEAVDGRPVFIREGIIVSDARGRKVPGYRALAVASHKPLADLLGDAENPAHTEWRPDTANFKDRYLYGPGYLSFVKESVAELVAAVMGSEDDAAPELLADLFSLPRDEALPQRVRKEGKPGREPVVTVPPATASKPRYRIGRVRGGFTLSRGSDEARPPAELVVRVAYDVRRGDPFRKYDPADFRLLKDVEMKEESRGLKLQSCSDNQLSLVVTDPDFHMTLVGFDENRDLVINVTARGEHDDAASPQLD